jgi:hypothetical protein
MSSLPLLSLTRDPNQARSIPASWSLPCATPSPAILSTMRRHATARERIAGRSIFPVCSLALSLSKQGS